MEDYKIKYKFLHCKNPKAIIEKLYPNKFKNTDYPNNQTKYLSFLDRVAEDGRFEELAMELGLTNYQTMTSEEEKIKEICGCNPCSLIENLSPQQKEVTCKGCVLSYKLHEVAQWKDEQHKQEKQQLIDKACEWIQQNVAKYIYVDNGEKSLDQYFFGVDFEKAMEEEYQRKRELETKDYKEYLYEISQYEKYGSKNIISFEDWLKIKNKQ